ncbi:NADH dehydrogenase [ubiquinone] 1 beta subcomplex subunit 4 [Amyelois transitella]|uniref:NADH dehydrogenase [ubiquinone] 1 beta subcomplex subunit 4 n=1 Tax=Amyelois transitella TaxID=680683 RepID=UPI00067B90DF|nr:NADH dehydrogenase [ubiquinone] 1 beta subcomplex subunit 4 [Amyelois transitella]
MSNQYGLSEEEFNVIKQQAARRAAMRKEFLKQSTNPFKHASEAGYVFDTSLQQFMSMKVTQFEHFKPNLKNSLFGICAIIIPMVSYGYLIWKDRNDREQKIRSGELLYKDRLFKFQ